MVNKQKSDIAKKNEPKEDKSFSRIDSDTEASNLTASLNALNTLARQGEQDGQGGQDGDNTSTPRKGKTGGKDIRRSGKPAKGQKPTPRTTSGKPSRSIGKKAGKSVSKSVAGTNDGVNGSDDSLGVAELIAALKSDIDSLRRDNEEFKKRLTSHSPGSGPADHPAGTNSENTNDVKDLLQALQADIGKLREENHLLQKQAFARTTNKDIDDKNENRNRDRDRDRGKVEVKVEEKEKEKEKDESRTADKKPNREQHELYKLLAELKQDIVTLRSENEALREDNPLLPGEQAKGRTEELALILKELKSDISELKHENESLRLESLTARDGARLDHLGGAAQAYRNSQTHPFTGLLKGLGMLALVALAAGGGYFLAATRTGGQQQVTIRDNMPVSADGGQIIAGNKKQQRPASVPSFSATKALQPGKETAPASPRHAIGQAGSDAAGKKTAMIANKAPLMPASATAEKPEPVTSRPQNRKISKDVEAAMMGRADNLLKSRDLGAARMVFVYLARQGSPAAMRRLARTYDPQYLEKGRFDSARHGDIDRARRLYKAAARMGDGQARQRLDEMP